MEMNIDKQKFFGALITNLSKAFDFFWQELIITKLNAYGFTLPALKLIPKYLSKREPRIKINNSYSAWSETLFGVPQYSLLKPILFKNFLSDLILVMNDINFASCADDNTIL